MASGAAVAALSGTMAVTGADVGAASQLSLMGIEQVKWKEGKGAAGGG